MVVSQATLARAVPVSLVAVMVEGERGGAVMTDSNHLVVAIAAGGTAGHVDPALALADELRSRGHEVHFFGETRRLEGSLVPQAGFPFHPVHVTGFDRQRPWTLVTALMHLAREEHRLVGEFQSGSLPMPDVAIGFGAYLELPLVHSRCPARAELRSRSCQQALRQARAAHRNRSAERGGHPSRACRLCHAHRVHRQSCTPQRA